VRRWLPLGIFLISFLLRLWGIGWGLPKEGQNWSYHPDEPVVYLYSRQIEPTQMDFEPGFYNYGTLYLTLLRVAGDVAETYGGGKELWERIGAAHMAGRLISALAGAGTALVVFLMLRRRLGDAGALFGALLVAFAPGHVIHSRFQTVDVLATLFLALSAHFALKLLPTESGGEAAGSDAKAYFKLALLAGLFAGLSAATKYTGILGLATFLLALAMAQIPGKPKLALAGCVSAVLAFIVTTPGVLLNSSKFLEDFKYEMQHTSQGHGVVFAGLPSGFVWHVYNLVVGVGAILALFGIVGLVWAMVRRDRAALALGAFFVLYFILIGRAEVLFLRYTFPLLLGLAYGFGWLVKLGLERRGWGHAIPALGMVGLGGLFGGGLGASAVASLWMSGPDPRDAAKRHIEAQMEGSGPKAVGLVKDPWFYTPPFFPDSGAPRAMPFEARDAAMRQSSSPVLQRFVPPNPDERFDWDSRLLDMRPEYVVFSSFETEGLDRLRGRSDLTPEQKLLTDRFVAFYERLKAEYELERTFGGTGWRVHDLEYIRPLMWIWKRKAS
jgi:hypothetical protein